MILINFKVCILGLTLYSNSWRLLFFLQIFVQIKVLDKLVQMIELLGLVSFHGIFDYKFNNWSSEIDRIDFCLWGIFRTAWADKATRTALTP